jgi:hypothetical protein
MSQRLVAADHRQLRAKEAKERRQTLGLLASGFVGALVVVAGLGVLVGTIVLVRYFKAPEAVFEVPPKQIKIPPKPPQHRMNVAKHEASRPKPTFTRKLVSTIPTEFALPDLPQVNLDQMLPLDPSELVSDQVTSLMGSSGIGNGLGTGLLGGGGSGSGMNFMGIRSEGSRILLLFDVSSSVVNKATNAGVPLEKIQEETVKLIQSLPIDTRFSLVQFTQNYKAFSEELLVATTANKEAAQEWVRQEWVTSGTMSSASRGVARNERGLVGVLEKGFAMRPDVVWIISDGSFQWSPGGQIGDIPYDELRKRIDELQGGLGKPAVLHFIGFEIQPEDEDEWKRIVRRYRGELKPVKK